MDKQKTDSIESKIDNSQVADEEVSTEAYEFDDIIDYDPVSDDDEAIDEGGHEIQIDENEETYDALDRIFKSTGLNSSRIEANVLFDGTLQVEEVTGGSICEPPQQNFKCGSCDKTEMHVDTSDGSENKKNCCPYCFKLQSKLARHIVDLHTEEADVQNLLKFDIGSKERKKMLDALKKRGNTRFNTDPKINKGKKMIVSRRPNSKFKRTGKDFRICAFCLGTYSMTSTRQHICTRKAAKGDRSLINLSRMVEGRWHKDASKALQTAMSGFNEDDIATLAKYDWLMITFGNSFCEQLDTLRQQKLVRQQLRILSRLLIEVKNNEATVTDFASIFQTNFVDSVIAAIRVIGRFNSTTNYFKSPSPATNLVTLVKKVGLLLRDECIANKNKQLKEQTEDFIALFTSRSTIKINKLAAKSRAKMSLERVETMPTTDEINKFQEFLNRKCDEYCQLLNAGSFADEREFSRTWIKLVEVTLVSIMMFNRRRVGEMQLCEISNYIRREKVTQDSKDLLFMTLSNESKKRVMRYSRMVMLGKRHVPVAVLLNPDIENRIDIILKFREAAGVPSTNQILFALPSSFEEKPRIVDACAALRKLTVESGIDNPKDIRGTKMRKHFANFCAAKGINDNTVTDVANFMGHSVDIHKKFYRGNALDRQVARISELLEESSGQSVSEVVNVPIKHVARKRAPKAQIEKSIGSSIDKQRQRQSLTQQTDTNFNPTVVMKLKKQPTTRDNNRMPTNSTRKPESNFVNNKRKNPSARSSKYTFTNLTFHSRRSLS
ncbi:uncharacterized protein LOC119072395 [Bradysia coprophila]|uniref:uncharacterized protein LOC119072395 n=1 Tax=Bradysia coprophila TaxID=38358 RepID=UPI00187D79A1|nr:uncharacterized protein LOC119072395 [Bradysia coprophila]